MNSKKSPKTPKPADIPPDVPVDAPVDAPAESPDMFWNLIYLGNPHALASTIPAYMPRPLDKLVPWIDRYLAGAMTLSTKYATTRASFLDTHDMPATRTTWTYYIWFVNESGMRLGAESEVSVIVP